MTGIHGYSCTSKVILLRPFGKGRQEAIMSLPPIGAWKFEQVPLEDDWKFQLVFTPKVN